MDTTDWITVYWGQIERGEVLVSQKVRKVYQRLAEGIANDDQPWVFDARKGNAPISFASRFLRQSKGAWASKPLEMEVWQKALTCAIFGVVDRETGRKVYSEVFLCVARKCGKSTWAAAILLFVMVCEGMGNDVFSLASKYDQAALIFTEAQAMVEQSPFLRARFKKRRSDLYMPATRSTFKPLGRNSNGSSDGLNASAAVIDECHVLAGEQGRDTYSTIKLSMGGSARPEPLLLICTTAGTVREGLFDDLYALAEKVIDGTLEDPHFLPVIYELDDPDTEWDMAPGEDGRMPDGSWCPWYKSNPSLAPLGRIKKLETMRANCERAKSGDPAFKPQFMCKDLNVVSTASTAWLTFQELENRERFDLEEFMGTWGILGIDLSQVSDLTAACLLLYRGGRFYVHTHFWIPEANVAERVNKDMVPYDKWHEQGHVDFCEGEIINYDDVTEWALRLVREHDISVRWVGYDPYAAGSWAQRMRDHGFDMVKVRQGHRSENIPLQMLGQLFKAHKVIYDDNPVLKWNLSNAVVEVSRNNTLALVKAGKPRLRNDGVSALIDAMYVFTEHEDEFKRLVGEG